MRLVLAEVPTRLVTRITDKSLPFGGGLEYAYAMFMADARFTYRYTYNNDLFNDGAKLNNWGVSGQIGVEF